MKNDYLKIAAFVVLASLFSFLFYKYLETIKLKDKLNKSLEREKILESELNKKYKNEECNLNECLFENIEAIVGFAKLQGYYIKTNKSDYNNPIICDSFVIKDGSKKLKEHFLTWIEEGNTVNFVNTDGDVVINLSLSDLSPTDKQKVLASKPGRQVTLSVIRYKPEPRGASSCSPFVGIVRVD